MLRDQAPAASQGTTKRARRLRREMTLPEVLLRQALRSRPAGLKFRRQHPSGAFILDFYCADAGLAIEVDGAGHGRGDRPLRDAAREVLRGVDDMVEGIVAACVARLPLHHPAARGGPLPRDKLGED